MLILSVNIEFKLIKIVNKDANSHKSEVLQIRQKNDKQMFKMDIFTILALNYRNHRIMANRLMNQCSQNISFQK